MKFKHLLLLFFAMLTIHSQEHMVSIIRQLSHPNPTMRKRAVLKLYNSPPKSTNAARALVKRFTDENKEVRQIAIMTLLKIGEPAMPAVYQALYSRDQATWSTAAGIFIAFKERATSFLQDKHRRERNSLMKQRIVFILQKNNAQPQSSKTTTPPMKTQENKTQPDALVRMLRKLPINDRRRAKQVAKTLQQLSTVDMVALTHLIAYNDKYISRKAIMALQMLGEKAVPAYLQIAESDNKIAQNNMLYIFQKLKDYTTPVYIKLLASTDSSIRQSAVVGLSKNYSQVTTIRKFLQDSNPDVRKSIAIVLGNMGKKASSAATSLVKSLNDEQFEVAEAALVALTKIGVKNTFLIPEKLLPSLEKSLSSPQKAIVMNTLHIIINTKASLQSPSLTNALSHKDSEVRLLAVEAITNHYSKNAQSALTKTLASDPNFYVRKKSLQALIKIDENTAAEALGIALGDKSYDLRLFAQQQFAQIGQKAFPTLTKLMSHSNDLVRYGSAYAFREIGTESLSILESNMTHRDWRVREAAIMGICGEEHAKYLVPQLIKALRDTKWEVVCASALTLGRMGKMARKAETALVEVILANTEGRGPLVEGLAKLMPVTQDSLNAFRNTITDRQWKTRLWSVKGLGNMGAKAKPMVDTLLLIITNTNEYDEIRKASQESVKKIIGQK